MTNSLRQENMWVALLWVFIFMVVLVWDQEKIVVLNLILFCYFLYYMVGESLNSTLQQKASIVREALSENINIKLNSLNLILVETSNFTRTLSTLIFSLIKKVNTTALTIAFNSTKTVNYAFFTINKNLFLVINTILFAYLEQTNVVASQRYLFTSNFVGYTTLPQN